MSLATVQDVATAIGRPITDDAEVSQVEYWLNAAELLITARLGDVLALDANKVIYVETEAVVVRLSNPNGYQSETIDDYTYRYGSGTRQVAILPEWWELLAPSTESEAFSTSPGFEPDILPDPWATA